MNAEQAYEKRIPLVFAVDQKPFQPPTGHRFCILYPLMTVEGERLQAAPETFPKRGRIWWKLRDDIPADSVVPGALWSGRIERATRAPRERDDADLFQASIHDIYQGRDDLVQILPLRTRDPELAWVQREIPLPWPKPTTPRVFLWGVNVVLGPLRAAWDGKQLIFSALSISQPEVLRLPVKDFFQVARVEQFHLNLSEHDYELQQKEKLTLVLTRTPWLNLDQLRAVGETLDASTDTQLVNWAAQYLGFNREQVEPVKQFLANLANDPSPAADASVARKRARFRQIAEDAERVAGLGEEAARTLLEKPAFTDLLQKHVEKLAGTRIDAEVARRQGEIDAALQVQHRALDQVKSDLENLAAEYEGKARAAEEDLQRRLGVRLDALEDRERQIGRRETGVVDMEAKLEKRLRGVIDEYRLEGDRLGDELLAQLPLLRHFGVGANGSTAAATPLAPTFVELRTPDFLHEKKSSDGPAVTEADFLEQLAQVVEQRGFLYQFEDLVNFHVCVKIGGLTILAGPSGTGKSSLPRFYAEALGCRDEYLHVPVRPDWLDDRDLIGAFNALAQRFEPSSSGLVEQVIAASLDGQKGRGGIYLVCLDEMNLARVEHYFAQFLSVLELPPEDRLLTLFAPGLVRGDDPYGPFQRVRLGDNLHFVGTVNIDETTHFFSPKVLDRCQVVAFGAADLAAPRRSKKADRVRGLRPVTLATYQSWVRPPREQSSAREFLLRINRILAASRLNLGFRQGDRILRYVESAQPFFNEDLALDFQVKQVILPRLRNTAPQFDHTIQELTQAIGADRFPKSAAILDRLREARAEDDYFQLI